MKVEILNDKPSGLTFDELKPGEVVFSLLSDKNIPFLVIELEDFKKGLFSLTYNRRGVPVKGDLFCVAKNATITITK